MRDPQEILTPELWDKVRRILFGEDPNGCSLKYAARKNRLRPYEILAWVHRSEMRHEEDPEWIWQIAEDFYSRDNKQAQSLRDRKWQIAMKGQKRTRKDGKRTVTTTVDHPQTIDRELEIRDPRYAKKPAKDPAVVIIPGKSVRDDLYERHKAQQRLEDLRKRQAELPPPREAGTTPVDDFLKHEQDAQVA